jgi:chemotaxis family two-component system response regulator Rcp1
MPEPIKLLLVEDNPGDVELTRENLRAVKILHELYVAIDGVEAMSFLRREQGHLDAPRPDLVLLDLNLPRKDGREVLTEMKADPSLQKIPVVILTSSQAEEDIARSYELHASAYVTKPLDLAGFGKIVRGIESFWLSVVSYPNQQ